MRAIKAAVVAIATGIGAVNSTVGEAAAATVVHSHSGITLSLEDFFQLWRARDHRLQQTVENHCLEKTVPSLTS